MGKRSSTRVVLTSLYHIFEETAVNLKHANQPNKPLTKMDLVSFLALWRGVFDLVCYLRSQLSV